MSGAFEFKRENNKEVKDRETDAEELPKLMKDIEEHERNIAKPPTAQVYITPFPKVVATFFKIRGQMTTFVKRG